MKDFWNSRYAEPTYAYGKAPNAFLETWLEKQPPGRILLPADGEGRNGVYAASLGWQVFSFDYSESARDKALRLAEEAGVEIEFKVASAEAIELPAESFDVVALTYVHLPPPIREEAWEKLYHATRPGGFLIGEWFHPDQIGRASGGPPDVKMLYTPELLRKEFAAWHIEEIRELITVLQEGPYHDGEAAVIRLVAQKPE